MSKHPAENVVLVFKVVSKPGGVDGMEFSDKGGKVLSAWFSFEAAKGACSPWADIVPEPIDLSALKAKLLASMDGVDKLALGLNPPGRVTR